jgi:dTDP-4-dehydrorhamnose reductase
VTPETRILILGANGQLGVELQRAFAGHGNVVAMGRDRCDLAVLDQISRVMAEVQPEIILNAAAYTAVDRAESEPELALRINGAAPRLLAEEACKTGALLVHYSTDYVFDGSKASPWVEDDPTGPLNTYGASKLAGEQGIVAAGGRHLIFRTSWVVSPHGNNFLRTMLRLGAERDQLKIVNDQTGAPTSALAIASATREVLNHLHSDSPWGIYHMTCAGQTTWCGFAQAIFQRARHPENREWARVTGIPGAEYPTPAARPGNSVLSNGKLHAAFDVHLPSWEQALDETLRTLRLL